MTFSGEEISSDSPPFDRHRQRRRNDKVTAMAHTAVGSRPGDLVAVMELPCGSDGAVPFLRRVLRTRARHVRDKSRDG